MFTPPVCRLLKPIRCRVSDAGFGMTGLNGTQVEPLNSVVPVLGVRRGRRRTSPTRRARCSPRCPASLWYRYRSPIAAVLLIPSVMAVKANPWFWANGPFSRGDVIDDAVDDPRVVARVERVEVEGRVRAAGPAVVVVVVVGDVVGDHHGVAGRRPVRDGDPAGVVVVRAAGRWSTGSA